MDGEIAVAREVSELVRVLKERESLDVIRSIVEARPHVLRERGVDGWLPIHHAINRYNSPEVIRYLLKQWPESIKEALTYDGCYLPMHLACFVAKVDATEEEGEVMLQNVRVLYELWPESLQQREEGDGCLPLHLAEDARRVRFLVRAWPHAVRERNSRGLLPLHFAVGDRRTFDAIECLVMEWPESVQEVDDYGRVALHCIDSYTPFESVQLLVKEWPESLRARDQKGFLPLHRAMRNGYPAIPLNPTLKFLVDQWPQAVREKSKDGYLPLHTAIFRSHPVSTIRFLVRQWEESVDEISNRGSLPLHVAARRGSIDTARFLIGRRPDSVRATTSGGFTPLHEAAWKGELEMVHFLIEQWSVGVEIKSNGGWLPIHMAVRGRACHESEQDPRLQVVRRLTHEFPGSLWETTEEGYLPLHAALTRGSSRLDPEWEDEFEPAMQSELQIVRYLVQRAPTTVRLASQVLQGISVPAAQRLVEAWPESLQSRTPDGYSLLHLAVARDDPSLEPVQYVAEQDPQLLQETDKHGSLPIHVAVALKQTVGIVRYLVEVRPQSLEEPDRTGSLALHIAVSRDVPDMKVVRFLAQRRPESLDETDRQGRLPLHIAVARGSDASQELVRFLVQRRRETLLRRDGRGRLPLHVAAIRGAPLDVLYFLTSTWPEAIYG
jgi:ankyrin repeat protein